MKNKKGFTLIELIIIISLLVVISGIFTVSLFKSINNQKDEDNKDTVAQILSAANAYVSLNPEKVDDLFNGYGFVEITVGELRDNGLLKEDMKDAHTGIRIPDGDIVRVDLKTGDYLNFTYPVEGDKDESEDGDGGEGRRVAWKLVAQDLYIDYDAKVDSQTWCEKSENVYEGLITDPANSDYANIKSKMYLMNNKEDDEEHARMYTKDYFDKNGVNLRVATKDDGSLACNVNPGKVGTYTITYKYFDEGLNSEKTAYRNVYVNSSNEDTMAFTVLINKGQPIVRGTDENEVPILIKEIYRSGAVDIPTTVGELASYGYEIVDFKVDTVGDSYVATIKRVVTNSDGSVPENQKSKYEVIPDTYTLTFNPGNGTVDPKSKIVTYGKPYGELPTPSRKGYDFDGWMTELGAGEEIDSETKMTKLADHTLYARWKAKTFTVTFNPNSGSVNPTSMTVTYDSVYGTLPTPTRGGYNFSGWYTSQSGGTAINDKTVVSILANQTLYAHWTPQTYNIIFDSNGCGGVSQTSKSVSYDSSYGTLPTTSKTNYVFNGWYTSATGGTRVEPNTKLTSKDSIGASNNNSSDKISSSGSGNLIDKVTPNNDTLGSSGSNKNNQVLYARCTYVEPPKTPTYKPSTSRPRPSGGSTSSGSSSTQSSCTPSCGNGCGNYTASANACSNEWHKVNNNPNLSEQEKKDKQDELHKQAMEDRAKAEGAKNPTCTGNKCTDSSGKVVTSYDSNTGVTTNSNGNRLTPTYNKGNRR